MKIFKSENLLFAVLVLAFIFVTFHSGTMICNMYQRAAGWQSKGATIFMAAAIIILLLALAHLLKQIYHSHKPKSNQNGKVTNQKRNPQSEEEGKA